MAILKFPLEKTVTTFEKPVFDQSNPTPEQIEKLKLWYYYGPCPVKVKWKEIIPDNQETDNR